MILELTKENLQKCGFKENDINDLLKQENHSCFLLSDTYYYANNLENKIYTKIDGYKKYYFENGSISFPINCPELIPSYFDLSLNAYLFQQKNLLKSMFIKEDQLKKFILVEIEKTKERIENQKVMLKRLPQINAVIKENAINIYDAYISFLNTKLTEPSTQPEIELIQQYKESVSNYISTIIDFTDKDGNKNLFYYNNRIVAFRKNIDEMLNSNNNVKERYDLLFSFNFKISNCLKDIAELFFAYHNYDEKEPVLLNDINFKLCDVKDSFESIKEIQQNIDYNISTGDYDIAIKIQKYCIPLFKEIKLISKRDFFIDIDKSPLNNEFDGVLKVLENCINYSEIQILKDLKKDNEREPQKTEITIPIAKDYKNTIWFKTGIKLATGEAFKLYSKYKLDKGHFTKICLELGFKKTDRPYFSDTINNNTSDKNTFLSNDKLQKLHKHLTENNLPIGAEFLEKYNQIEAE